MLLNYDRFIIIYCFLAVHLLLRWRNLVWRILSRHSRHHRQYVNSTITVVLATLMLITTLLLIIVPILSNNHHLQIDHILILYLQKRSYHLEVVLLWTKLVSLVFQLSYLVLHSSYLFHQLWFFTVFTVVCCWKLGQLQFLSTAQITLTLVLLFVNPHHFLFLTHPLQHSLHPRHLCPRVEFILPLFLLIVTSPLRHFGMHIDRRINIWSLSGDSIFGDRSNIFRLIPIPRLYLIERIRAERLVRENKLLLSHFPNSTKL